MKLAEALVERKAIKTKMEELKKRIYQHARIQEGETVIEDPTMLLEELAGETEKFEHLVSRINRTNNEATLPDGMPVMEAIIKKDMLNYLHFVYVNLADKATPTRERYSQREIRDIPNVDITAIRKKADELAKAYRMLDMKIQECNWTVELQS